MESVWSVWARRAAAVWATWKVHWKTYIFHALLQKITTIVTKEPGGLSSIGLQRVGHDWSGWACDTDVCQRHSNYKPGNWSLSLLSSFHHLRMFQGQHLEIFSIGCQVSTDGSASPWTKSDWQAMDLNYLREEKNVSSFLEWEEELTKHSLTKL